MAGILQKLVEEDFGISGRGKWLHSEEHDSLVINSEEDKFFWNSTGQRGSPFDYLVNIRGMTKQEAKEFLKSIVGGFSNNSEQQAQVVQYDRLKKVFWLNGITERSYWYNRCLTDETIDRRELGYYDGWFTVPLYDENGNFNNIQMRRDEPQKSMHYWYKTGNVVLFNQAVLQYTKKVYIVEGLIDCILLNQSGLTSVCAAGANTWKQDWFIKFSKQEEIVYIADNDEAGLRAAKAVAKSLGKTRVKIVVFKDKPDKYDSVDFFRENKSVELYKEYIENNQRFEFEI